MKTFRIVTLVEVDDDDFRDAEALVNFINGCLDNAPDPSEIDESLKDVSIGISYCDGVEKG